MCRLKYLKSAMILLLPAFTFSQNKINEKQQIWLGYITQTKLSYHLSWWNDAHWVPESFGIVRTGLIYHFGKEKQFTATFGYAFATFYPPEGKSTFRPEHRPWGQSTYQHQYNSFTFLHRLRYEARYREIIVDDNLQNEFNFNYRFRYLLQMRYFLKTEKTGKLFLTASDELLFNAGSEIKNSFRLDQNRISAGLGYQYKNVTFQLAYMNQLIESNVDNTFKMNHNLQLLVFHHFDLKKKSNLK